MLYENYIVYLGKKTLQIEHKTKIKLKYIVTFLYGNQGSVNVLNTYYIII